MSLEWQSTAYSMVGANISVASSHLVLELRLVLLCLVLRLVNVSRFGCGLAGSQGVAKTQVYKVVLVCKATSASV